MSKGHFATGTVEGTGAAINVQLGFTPDYVKLINIDGDASLEWISDMADGEGYKTVAMRHQCADRHRRRDALRGCDGHGCQGLHHRR